MPGMYACMCICVSAHAHCLSVESQKDVGVLLLHFLPYSLTAESLIDLALAGFAWADEQQ